MPYKTDDLICIHGDISGSDMKSKLVLFSKLLEASGAWHPTAFSLSTSSILHNLFLDPGELVSQVNKIYC